jgi:hypothetical protein
VHQRIHMRGNPMNILNVENSFTRSQLHQASDSSHRGDILKM